MKNFLLTIQPYLPISIISVITLLSLFLHFYLLPTHLHFATDEANMSIAIKEIVTMHNFPTLGPSASVGADIFHGAFFYYLYLIPGIISGFNPLGFAYFTALLSVVSVILLYLSLRDIFDERIALIAAFLYTISENVNIYGRWEWNPNTIPFFTVLSLYALSQVLKGKTYFLILFAFSISAITQLHLTGYMFLPIVAVMVFPLRKVVTDKWVWGVSAGSFLLPWIPTIYHEMKGHFQMFRALIHLFLHPSVHVSFFTHAVNGYFTMLFLYNEVLKVDDRILFVLGISGICWLGYIILKQKDFAKRYFSSYILLIVVFSFLMYAFYPSIVFIHYGEQLFPVFPILSAFVIAFLFHHKITVLIGVVVCAFIFSSNWVLFDEDIIHGREEFATQNKICEFLQKGGIHEASLLVNNITNPIDVGYVCSNEYAITLTSGRGIPIYDIKTDDKAMLDIRKI